MGPTFSTFATCESLDIDYQRFAQWRRKGYIEIEKEAGRGTKAELSKYDAYRIERFRQLIDEGWKRDAARKFIDQLSDEVLKNQDFMLYRTELKGHEVTVYANFFEDKKSALKHLGSYTFTEVSLFDLGNLKRNVDKALPERG
jgi:hypothetical protein